MEPSAIAFYLFAAVSVIASIGVVGQRNPMYSVMLLNVGREDPAPGLVSALGPKTLKIGAVLSVVLGIEIVWALSRVGLGYFAQDDAARSVSSVARIGAELFTRHAFAFEATSILILVAMIGAVVIARKEH